MAATRRREAPSGEDNIVCWVRPKFNVIITDKTERNENQKYIENLGEVFYIHTSRHRTRIVRAVRRRRARDTVT
jgi:hypothetical protein